MTVLEQQTYAGITEPAAYKLARLAAHYDGIDFLKAIRPVSCRRRRWASCSASPFATLLRFGHLRDDSGGKALQPDRHGARRRDRDSARQCDGLRAAVGASGRRGLLDPRHQRALPAADHRAHRFRRCDRHLVHKGRRTATAEARLVDETVGQVLATATSTLLVLS